MMFVSDDDMIECPYNNSHRMLRKRLQSHLLKCRVNYPNVELRKCPFNLSHLIPEPEFTHHATNCPDRKLITQYKYDAPETVDEEVPKHKPIESEENWDETDVQDYDPNKYVENATVIRQPEGQTPSARKQFIKKERKRLGDADSDDEIDNRNNSPPNEEQYNCDEDPYYNGDRYANPSPPPPPIYSRNEDGPSSRSYRDKEDRYHRRNRSRSPKRSSRDRSPSRSYAKSSNSRSSRDRSPLSSYANSSHSRSSRDRSPSRSYAKSSNSRSSRDRSPSRSYTNSSYARSSRDRSSERYRRQYSPSNYKRTKYDVRGDNGNESYRYRSRSPTYHRRRQDDY
ncbi:uncharacterized protein isoform X2 [Musca autumnalis]